MLELVLQQVPILLPPLEQVLRLVLALLQWQVLQQELPLVLGSQQLLQELE